MGSALWSQLAGDAVKWPGNVPVTSCWDQISTKQIIAVKDFPFGQKMSHHADSVLSYFAIVCLIVLHYAL